jgi:glucose uptake protein
MLNVFFALVTVFAWGTWLAPSQHVPMKGQQTRTFYVTMAVLLTAIVVAFFKGFQELTLVTAWLPFLGGVIWALSGLSAFVGTQRLGMAKAFGIWAPLNIIVSILWGILLFGEFLHTGTLNIVLAVASFLVIIGGILMIIFSGSEGDRSKQSGAALYGYLGALGAGIGWASYFIPIRISGLSVWVAMLPLAAGMFAGGAVICMVSKSSLHLEKPSHYVRVLSTGLLWAAGNYCALLMMQNLGTGKGFTIAQLCVVVNALMGVFWEHTPRPGTRAAYLTLAGVVVATIGAAVLGNLK